MANSEDYLDGLLQSISDAKTTSSMMAEREEVKRQQRIAERTRIKSDDDFMSKTGINDFSPKPVKRTNLRKALTEADFLKDFEDELMYGDADDFIADFEREIDEEEQAYAEGREVENDSDTIVAELIGEELSDDAFEAAEDTFEAAEADSPYELESDNTEFDEIPIEDLGSGAVDSVISEPKKMESSGDADVDDILSMAMMALEGEEIEEVDNEESLSSEEFQRDEFEQLEDESIEESYEDDGLLLNDEGFDSDEEAFNIDSLGGFDGGLDLEEPSILDENDENVDLMSMLGDSEELGDIGDLLNADEAGLELDEARDEFEASAESQSGEPKEEGVEKPKGGIFAKIKAIFAGLFKDDEEEDDTVEVHENATFDDTSSENADILAEFEGEAPLDPKAAKAAAKEAKKKEKEEKKNQKEAENKEKAAAKAEKKKASDAAKKIKAEKKAASKVPDNSPKIPIKHIIVWLVLAASFVALILLFTKLIGYKTSINNAKSAYENGNYIEGYYALNGVEVKEQDVVLYNQIYLMAVQQQKLNSFNIFMQNHKYDLALDQLILAYGTYRDNSSDAASLGIGDAYDEFGAQISASLSENFHVSSDEAYVLYSMESRQDYTVAIMNILKGLGLSVE